MVYDENTYQYIEKASVQIEGITCTLATYIENIGNEIRKNHYEVYNDFFNEVRKMHIESVKKIKELFSEIECTIKRIASMRRISYNGEMVLHSKLSEFDDLLYRLVIRCENIPECISNTDNPNIADADDEIYRLFSKYRTLIDQYSLSQPADSDDLTANLIYSFFVDSMEIYAELFSGYDNILMCIGERLEPLKKSLIRKSNFFKAKDAIKTTVEVATNATGIPVDICEKNVLGIVEKGIGICAFLAEEYKDIFPEKSKAYNVLNSIETLGKTIELTDEMSEFFGDTLKDSTAVSAFKIFIVSSAMSGKSVDIQQLNKSHKLDILINSFGLVNSAVSIFTSGSIVNLLLKLPDAVSNALGLLESIGEFYGKNNMLIPVKSVNGFLREHTKKIVEYRKEMKEYEEKVKKKIPVKRPKFLPYMEPHEGISFAADIIEIGGNVYDFTKEIL